MAENIKRHISHLKSSGGTAPAATALTFGEIAVGYLKGKETLYIKNNSGDVVSFVDSAQGQALAELYADKHDISVATGANGVSATLSDVANSGRTLTVSHSTAAGYKHIPSGGSSGQFLGWDSAGTAKWVSNPNSWRSIKVNGTNFLTDTSTALNLSGGSNVTLTTGSTGLVTIATSQPTVNNGTLTISGNGTSVATFSANQSGNSSLIITGGTNVTVTPDATNHKITISASQPTVNNGTFTISGNGASVGSTSANASNNTGVNIKAGSNITITTGTSEITIAGKAGTVTKVSTASGLTGGDITSSGTIGLAATGTSGTYGPAADVTGSNNTTIKVPQITTDAYGRVTSITERTYTSVDHTYTVNNGTLNLQANGTTKTSFTANQSTTSTFNITSGSSNGTISVGGTDVNVKGFLESETTLSSTSNTKLPTSKAVADYVTSQMTSVLTYKGTVSKNSDLPASHKVGDVYVVASAGTYVGKACEVGDYIICKKAGSTASDTDWDVINGENQVENKSASLAAAGSSATIATVDGTNITITTPSTWTGVAKTGTVTKVSTGAGLTGGDITSTGTIKAALSSETKSTLAATAMGSTENRQYAVGLDKNGVLSVNIPWTNTNSGYVPTGRTITTASGLTGGGNLSADRTIGLAATGTSGTYGPAADVTGTEGTTIKIPQITTDAYGRVTAVTERTYTSKNSTYTVNNGAFTVSGNGASVASTSANASNNTGVNIKAGTNVTITTGASEITIAASQPTVNNGTFTISGNGASVASTSANASANSGLNIKPGSNVSITTGTNEISIAATNTTYTAGSFVTITGTSNAINVSTGTSSSTVARGDHSHSAYQNQNAFSNIKVGSTTVAADTATDTVEFAVNSNGAISITGDATNDKVTFGLGDIECGDYA